MPGILARAVTHFLKILRQALLQCLLCCGCECAEKVGYLVASYYLKDCQPWRAFHFGWFAVVNSHRAPYFSDDGVGILLARCFYADQANLFD